MQSRRIAVVDAVIQSLFMLFLAVCPLFLGAQTEIQPPAIQTVAQSRFAEAKDSSRADLRELQAGTTTISARTEYMGREQRYNQCAVA